MTEYNLIISRGKYRLIRVGAKKATATFRMGDMLQQYIGFLLLNRDCKVIVHRDNTEVSRIIESSGRS